MTCDFAEVFDEIIFCGLQVILIQELVRRRERGRLREDRRGGGCTFPTHSVMNGARKMVEVGKRKTVEL